MERVRAPADGEGPSLAASLERDELRWGAGAPRAGRAALAVEVPVALEYNGVSHAVMLATPSDLEDFALGFSLSEGILATRGDFLGAEAREDPPGITLSIRIAAGAFAALKERRRTLAGRTGCGLCGTESLQQVLRPIAPVAEPAWRLDPRALSRALGEMRTAQGLSQATGATHAAAWCAADGSLLALREDVGRHNALDKLIGAMLRSRLEPAAGFACITSRASVEMVQKAASAGIALLAAVSGPTTLAVDTAQACGLTLVGFARGESFAAYSHPGRIRGAGAA